MSKNKRAFIYIRFGPGTDGETSRLFDVAQIIILLICGFLLLDTILDHSLTLYLSAFLEPLI